MSCVSRRASLGVFCYGSFHGLRSLIFDSVGLARIHGLVRVAAAYVLQRFATCVGGQHLIGHGESFRERAMSWDSWLFSCLPAQVQKNARR